MSALLLRAAAAPCAVAGRPAARRAAAGSPPMAAVRVAPLQSRCLAATRYRRSSLAVRASMPGLTIKEPVSGGCA
jgi:hypothetical protein